MAPWWLRSAEDEAPIDVIEMTGDESAAGDETPSNESAQAADTQEGGGKRRSRSRRRRRRREDAETVTDPVAQHATPDEKPAVEEAPPAKPAESDASAPAVETRGPADDSKDGGSNDDGKSRPRRRRRRRGRQESGRQESGRQESAPQDRQDRGHSKPSRQEPSRPKQTRQDGGRRHDASKAPESKIEAPPVVEPAVAPQPAPQPLPVTPPVAVSPVQAPTPEMPEPLSSGVVYIPDRGQDERKIAMFFDFENIALGVRDTKDMTFDVGLVLARLLEKGKIIVKRAYADWQRYAEFKRPLHEAAIEMIDIPKKRYSGKNSADIKMVVDAMDLCYAKEHLDTFVLVSGDSDFSPLVSKLKENDKYVIGLGMKGATSHLLVDNCDEFIYYEDVWRDAQQTPRLSHVDDKSSEVFQLIVEAMQALIREDKDVLWGSMIKQTMKRKRPSFNEGYYGYSTFSELLEDAEKKDIIRLRRDQRSGGYIVTGFASRQSPKH